LFQATQNNLESLSPNATIPYTSDHEATDHLSELRKNFSGSYVTMLANDLVAKHGSPTVVRLNDILDNWHRSWELRKCRDLTQENRTFSCDPIQFWWLAKLFLVLHLHRHSIEKDSEWAALGLEPTDEHAKSQNQLKVVSWLLQFRKPNDEVTQSTEHYLARFVKPSDGG
jgi:hypothetical protein